MEENPIQVEQDALMVSPTGKGDPFHQKAYFLKPIHHHQPPLKNHQTGSNPFPFNPKECSLEVEFLGWRYGQEDWNSWVDHLSPLHRSTWKKAGIYNAILSSKFNIRRKNEVVFGLAEKWCCETNTFVFRWGEAAITLEDVMVLGGFSVTGDSVFDPVERIEMKNVEERLMKASKELNRARASLWLQKFMKSESDLEHEAFLTFWLSRYVFHDETDRYVAKHCIPIAIRLARGTRIALAQPLLADIYTDLSMLKVAILASSKLKAGDCGLNIKLKSRFDLVQIWAWERFVNLAPTPNVIKQGEPRLARWDKVNGRNIEHLRSVLDSAGEDFMWRPYVVSVKNWSFPRYYSEKEMCVIPVLDAELLAFSMCVKVAELVGFDSVKQYLPHRVAMQFGYDQDVPRKITESEVSGKHCDKKTETGGFYIPSRFYKPSVSARYFKWWNASVSGLEDTSEGTLAQRTNTKKMERGSSVRTKQTPAPVIPGYSRKEDIKLSEKRKSKESVCLMQTAPEIMFEEREELIVSPFGGDPFLRKAYYLKPVMSSSTETQTVTLPTECFSSFSSQFESRKWPLEVEIPGWRIKGEKDWNAWVDQMAPVHQCTWKKAGIYEAIMNSTYEIRRKNELIYGIAEKWCSETTTFVFPWGEATITLEDIMVLGGYSILGEFVKSPLESTELKEIEAKLNEERSEFSRTVAKKATSSLWLKKFINCGSSFEHEAFLSYWLSRHVFSDARSTIRKHVFPVAVRLARGVRVALAPAVLASIYEDLSLLKCAMVDSSTLTEGCEAIKLSIKSPFQFVQLWVWERFIELSPSPGTISFGQPRLARWNQLSGVDVKNMRRVFESPGDGFRWRPYVLNFENFQMPKYYPVDEIYVLDCDGLDDELESFFRCLRASELAGFSTIQQYHPHRVAMQFGFDQDIPCLIARHNHSPDTAWDHYMKEAQDVRLYVPSRHSNGHVSTRYLTWWKESMKKLSKSKCAGGSMPRAKPTPYDLSGSKKVVKDSKKRKKTNDITTDSASVPDNDPLVPPGFDPKCSMIEAEDEDDLTLAELPELHKKRRKYEVQIGGSSVGEGSASMNPERLETRVSADENGHDKEHNSGESETNNGERLVNEDPSNEVLCGAENLKTVMGSNARSSNNVVVHGECVSSSTLSRASVINNRLSRLEFIMSALKEYYF